MSPAVAIDAFLKMLALAEHYKQWDLVAALLTYAKEAGGKVARVGDTGEWLFEVPLKELE